MSRARDREMNRRIAAANARVARQPRCKKHQTPLRNGQCLECNAEVKRNGRRGK
jgi:hypothetical protein